MAGCIDRGLNQVQHDLQTIQGHVATVRAIQETLEPTQGSRPERQQRFESLRDRLRDSADPIQRQMAKVMASFQPGLFVGPDAQSAQDNLSLERWFRLPRGHERRIHGHRHAGVRLVQEGPTLALDAHVHHPEPFTPADLHPYRRTQPPPCHCEALARRKTMRMARSQKQRPLLLAELEARYLDST